MKTGNIVLFLLVTFIWSWGFWSLPVMLHLGMALPPSLAEYAASGTPAAWGPLVGAIVVALVRGGPAALWALLKRALMFRFGWPWYLVVLGLFPLLVGGSYLLALLLGETVVPTEAMEQPVLIPIAFVYILLTGGPLQEEFGWRGTLLDPMQERFGALRASLVVGVIWALWHLPLFYFPNEAAPFYDRPFWGLFISVVMMSVLFTWVWNNTGGSIAAVMLLHTTFNIAHWTLPAIDSDLAAGILFVVQFAVVAAVVFIFGPARLRRAPG
jgi:membrane protease YdiL (CAAX protease family)